MKIYIIGPPGSGKTTLSKILENKYHTKAYELDCVVHDDFDHHQKRSSQDITNRFNQIIKQNNWIIEDVGRDIFNEGLKEADIIYYLKIPKKVIMIRVIKRWIKQRLGKEYEVIVEDVSEDDEYFICRSMLEAPDVDGRIYIKIDEESSKKIIIGDYTSVKIIDYNEYDLFAKVI